MHEKRIHRETEEPWFLFPGTGRKLRYGTYTFTVPSNREYSVPQLKMLLHEVGEGIGRKITIEEWDAL